MQLKGYLKTLFSAGTTTSLTDNKSIYSSNIYLNKYITILKDGNSRKM